MKTLFSKIIFLLILLSTNIINAQVFVKKLDPIKDAKLISQIATSGDKGTPFLEGSKISQSGLTFTIQLPNNHYYLMLPTNGQVFRTNSVKVTCSCSGGGCSPVEYGGGQYCVMDDCNVCKKTTSGKLSNGTEVPVTIIGVEVEGQSNIKVLVNTLNDGFINRALETKTNFFKSIHPELFNFRDLSKELIDLYSLIYNGNIPAFITNNQDIPNQIDYVYIEASLYGNLILIPILKSINDQESNLRAVINAGNSTCTCSEGSGCKKKSTLGAKYCDAGSCSVCTLETN